MDSHIFHSLFVLTEQILFLSSGTDDLKLCRNESGKVKQFGTTPNDPQDMKVLMLYFALGMSGRQWKTACFITTDYSPCHYIKLL